MKNSSSKNKKTKKEIVIGSKNSSGKYKYIVVTAVLIVTAAVGFYYLGATKSQPGSFAQEAASESQKTVTAESVAYPVAQFDDGMAHYFEHRAQGMTIRYFILKSSDNTIRAAFDACDVCWRAGKGYAQDGDDMVCRNCGRRFSSVRINEVQGGCNPAPLHRTVDGDQLVIRIQDIVQGKQYFDFS